MSRPVRARTPRSGIGNTQETMARRAQMSVRLLLWNRVRRKLLRLRHRARAARTEPTGRQCAMSHGHVCWKSKKNEEITEYSGLAALEALAARTTRRTPRRASAHRSPCAPLCVSRERGATGHHHGATYCRTSLSRWVTSTFMQFQTPCVSGLMVLAIRVSRLQGCVRLSARASKQASASRRRTCPM